MVGSRRIAALSWRYGRTLRWGVAAICLVMAMLSVTHASVPAQPQTITVAARPVASGSQLVADDLALATGTLPVTTPPMADLVGERVRGPLEPGEPVTSGRIVPGGQVAPEPGTVVFPLSLADERIAALLQSGDRVDVLVTPDSLHEGEPRLVAGDIEVLAVPAMGAAGLGPASPQLGAVILLGAPESAARDLAAIRRSDHVSVAIR